MWRNVCLTIAAAAIVLLPAVHAARAKAEEAPAVGAFDSNGNQTTSGQMLVTVTDENGRPLAGVKIRANTVIDGPHEPGFAQRHDYQTDGQGRARVLLPPKVHGPQLRIAKAGYVSRFRNWAAYEVDQREPLPQEITFALRKGATIGGTVVDEDGYPIRGAEILLGQTQDTKRRDREVLGDDERIVTDAQGHWQTDRAGPDDDQTIFVAAIHPEFVSLASLYTLYNERNAVPLEELRDQTARIVMQFGLRVTGTVTNPEGQPVAGALVMFGDHPGHQHFPRQQVRTDEHGVYRLPPMPEGRTRITVVAKGWMPELEQFELFEGQPPLDFRLQKGKTLRVRVVDAAGAPVPKAYFQLLSWRGRDVLYNMHPPDVLDLQIPSQADENGLFEWTWAPADAVTWNIGAGGREMRNVSLTADDDQIEVVLPKPRRR